MPTLRLRRPNWVRTMRMRRPTNEADAVDLSLALAERNVAEGTGGPFGAVVFGLDDFRIVGIGVNSVEASGTTILHAEVSAIVDAQQKVGWSDWSGKRYGIACSCQPCIMCLGAVHWARLRRVVYSAYKCDAEGIGFDEGPGVSATVRGLKERGITFTGGIFRSRGQMVLAQYRLSGGKIY